MTRATQLLLLLLASWLLLVAPCARLPRVMSAAPPAVGTEERVRANVEHAVLETATRPIVKAPLAERLRAVRLPAAVLVALRVEPSFAPAHGVHVPDLREALRRVQTRRRLPRPTPEEPPWC